MPADLHSSREIPEPATSPALLEAGEASPEDAPSKLKRWATLSGAELLAQDPQLQHGRFCISISTLQE